MGISAPAPLKEKYIDEAIAEFRACGLLDDECVDCQPDEEDCEASMKPGAKSCVKRAAIMQDEDILDRAAHLQDEAEGEELAEERSEGSEAA
jgi:hypothetical protein